MCGVQSQMKSPNSQWQTNNKCDVMMMNHFFVKSSTVSSFLLGFVALSMSLVFCSLLSAILQSDLKCVSCVSICKCIVEIWLQKFALSFDFRCVIGVLIVWFCFACSLSCFHFWFEVHLMCFKQWSCPILLNFWFETHLMRFKFGSCSLVCSGRQPCDSLHFIRIQIGDRTAGWQTFQGLHHCLAWWHVSQLAHCWTAAIHCAQAGVCQFSNTVCNIWVSFLCSTVALGCVCFLPVQLVTCWMV